MRKLDALVLAAVVAVSPAGCAYNRIRATEALAACDQKTPDQEPTGVFCNLGPAGDWTFTADGRGWDSEGRELPIANLPSSHDQPFYFHPHCKEYVHVTPVDVGGKKVWVER